MTPSSVIRPVATMRRMRLDIAPSVMPKAAATSFCDTNRRLWMAFSVAVSSSSGSSSTVHPISDSYPPDEGDGLEYAQGHRVSQGVAARLTPCAARASQIARGIGKGFRWFPRGSGGPRLNAYIRIPKQTFYKIRSRPLPTPCVVAASAVAEFFLESECVICRSVASRSMN